MRDQITILTYLSRADAHCSLSEIADENEMSLGTAIAGLVRLELGGWVTEKNTFNSRLCYLITELGIVHLRELIRDEKQ